MSWTTAERGWLLHARSCAEREFLDPLRPFLPISEYIEEKAWRAGFDRAFVGLHGASQAERAKGSRPTEKVVVALVELFEQWTAEYLYGHDSQCLRTIGSATYVLAPTCIKRRLEAGILSDHTSFVRGVVAVCERMREFKHAEETGRYQPERVSPGDFHARLQALSKLASRTPPAWVRDRIVDAGLPRVAGVFFDGARLRAPVEARWPDGVVAFIEQGHDAEVRDSVAELARAHGLAFVTLPRPLENETEAERAERIERGRAALHAATLVVTEYSNLAYQAALHGKCVLYCSWRSGFRPLPLLVSDGTFAHVREAAAREHVEQCFRELIAGEWVPAPGPVPTTDPAATVNRLLEVLEHASPGRSLI